MRLLTTGNPKTAKGTAYGYHTGILHLSPAKTAGVGNVCPWATKGCLRACLNTAGRAGIIKTGETTNVILEARKRRTRYLQTGDGSGFKRDLHTDLVLLQNQAKRQNLKPAARLNGTSDLDWTEYIENFPRIQFYDYTKSFDRMRDFLSGRLPKNYHLTFSRTEDNDGMCRNILSRGGNIAVVTMTGNYLEGPVHGGHLRVSGDTHDLTFLHPAGSILVLRAKGRAREDTSGFVLDC